MMELQEYLEGIEEEVHRLQNEVNKLEAENRELRQNFWQKGDGYIMGYPVRSLILLAEACRRQEVSEDEIKNFVNNASNAYEFVYKDQEAALKLALEGARVQMNAITMHRGVQQNEVTGS